MSSRRRCSPPRSSVGSRRHSDGGHDNSALTRGRTQFRTAARRPRGWCAQCDPWAGQHRDVGDVGHRPILDGNDHHLQSHHRGCQGPRRVGGFLHRAVRAAGSAEFGPFLAVTLNPRRQPGLRPVARGRRDPPQHYAFLVSEDEFDDDLRRASAQRGMQHWADPRGGIPVRSTITTGAAGCTSRIPAGTTWRSSPGPTAAGAADRGPPARRTPTPVEAAVNAADRFPSTGHERGGRAH